MLERMKLLVDDNVINKIKGIKVLIVGIGGVGGACFEALVRLGITNITVIDNDKTGSNVENPVEGEEIEW